MLLSLKLSTLQMNEWMKQTNKYINSFPQKIKQQNYFQHWWEMFHIQALNQHISMISEEFHLCHHRIKLYIYV